MMRRLREPRFLRSDGKPDFANRIYEEESEIEKVMNPKPETVTPKSTISDLLKKMNDTGYRRLPAVSGDNLLVGIVSATDVINYFGGGSLSLIIRERHKMNIFKAYNEKVERIMQENVVYADLGEKLRDIVEKMYRFNVGGLPVVYNGKVVGFISEKDVVAYFVEDLQGSVREHMSRDPVSVEHDASLTEAMKLMVETGYRRLLVSSSGRPLGVVSAMDIVRYLASEKPFQRAVNGRVDEALNISVSEVATPEIIGVDADTPLREAFDLMSRNGVGMLAVRDKGKIVGVITERDLLNALALAHG